MYETKKILIVSSDSIGEKMAGPAIRYFNMASILSKTNDVTILVPNKVVPFPNLNMIRLNKKNLVSCMKKADIIIIQGMTLFNFPAIKKFEGSIIIDLYDPTMLETLEIRNKDSEYIIDLEIVKEQLRYGDYFICASDKQKDLWIGMLLAVGRILPSDYKNDKKLNKLIGIVPFGIEQVEPTKKANPYLKFSNINEKDKILVWGGGIWDWLDPFTLIKAMDTITQIRKDIKVVFMGTKHPTQTSLQMKAAEEAILLAEKYNLSGKYVFFNDWVPYAERDQYLLHSFAGVSFHINHLETKYSFRTRILDYIWCQLPMIVSKGDLLGDVIDKNDCGITVGEMDTDGLVHAIIKLADDDVLHKRFKNNLGELKKSYFWEIALIDLLEYCESPQKEFKRKKDIINRLYLLKLFYYLTKVKYIFTKKGFTKIVQKIKNMRE